MADGAFVGEASSSGFLTVGSALSLQWVLALSEERPALSLFA